MKPRILSVGGWLDTREEIYKRNPTYTSDLLVSELDAIVMQHDTCSVSKSTDWEVGELELVALCKPPGMRMATHMPIV